MSETASNLSKYGRFDVEDSLELSYPETDIKFKREIDESFHYYRKNMEGSITEKIITRTSEKLQVEVCPILPINLPAKKTNDLMFLRFEKQIYVSKNSKVDIFVPFPIEIGVFVINDDGKSSLLDCFTCEPIHSRFGLYGTPENGHLCMYAKVPISKHRESFVFALTKISIVNNTDSGQLVGRIVFPVTEHNMYYVENSTEAHIDDLSMILENDLGKIVARVSKVNYTPKPNWKIAPTIATQDEFKEFLMDRGVD